MASFAALPPRVEFDLGKKRSRRPQEAMTGMIGRVAVNSVPTQIYVHLRPGNVAAPTDLDALNRRLNPTGSGVIQIEFAGVLKMPQDENCRIIFSGQHSRVVLIDNQQISTSSAIPLAAGDHEYRRGCRSSCR